MNIYIVNIWRDEVGFDGYYTGPFTKHSVAEDSAKQECEKLGYTWKRGQFSACNRSEESLVDGTARVRIRWEELKNPTIYFALKELIHDSE